MGGTRLGGVILRSPNLTLMVIFPVSSMVTRSLGSLLGGIRFFRTSIRFAISVYDGYPISRGKGRHVIGCVEWSR